MNINVEIGNGITIKVDSAKYYSCSDEELERFIEENMIYTQHHWHIKDPFDNSVIDTFVVPNEEETDKSLDFNPKDWD